MNRGELAKALDNQPFDTDVQVNVGGFNLDVAAVRFDRIRHAIILDLFAEEGEQALRALLHPGCFEPGCGDSL
jgi:hypothetical protein